MLFLYLIYSQLGWSGMVDREVCHQSIIYRATLPGFGGSKEFIPLKCKTQKVCITSGIIGGSCKEFNNSKGVVKVKVKTKDQIEQYVAREIIDCWKMTGEGKVSIFSQWIAESYGLGSVYPSCIICSRIAFDEANLKKAGINLADINVMSYMMTHKIPDKNISYYNYLAGEKGKITTNKNVAINNMQIDSNGNLVEGEKINVDVGDLPKGYSSNELSVMFMQISSPDAWNVLKNDLLTLGVPLGGSFAIAPVATGKGIAALAKSPYFWAVLAIAAVYQAYSVYDNWAISAGYCGDVETGSTAKKGCSVIRTVNYNVDDIKKYCSVIESIP